VLTRKKRKVYELILVIINKPRLNYNIEEKQCQLSESPEVVQRVAKVKARWFSAAAAVSKSPATKQNECHEESPWWIRFSTRNFVKRAHTLPAAQKQNITAFHARFTVA
jgi:hypothetical protein